MDEQHSEQLARIDERTISMAHTLDRIQRDLDKNYVTRAEFGPVKTVVFSMVGLVLTTVLSAVVLLVIN